MEPHQQRVIDEQRELSIKVIALALFISKPIFAEVEADEQSRLTRQLIAMSEYNQILRERINAFTSK